MLHYVTYPASGNEINFLFRNSRTSNRGRLSNMLVVTTTVRMVNRVHSNTTSTGPAIDTRSDICEINSNSKKTYL